MASESISRAPLSARIACPVFLVFVLSLLAGCGMESVLPTPAAIALHGGVLGGQQPVSGAVISLYAADLSGAGAGAVNLRLDAIADRRRMHLRMRRA